MKDNFLRQKFVLLVCSEHLTRSVELNITNIKDAAKISYVYLVLARFQVQTITTGLYSCYYF